MNKQTLTAWSLVAVSLVGLAQVATANPVNHPRVKEVNARRAAQHERIQRGINNGSLTRGEARQLRQDGRSIHEQEKAMRAANGGHLTKDQQIYLNRQQNERSREIKAEKHD